MDAHVTALRTWAMSDASQKKYQPGYTRIHDCYLPPRSRLSASLIYVRRSVLGIGYSNTYSTFQLTCGLKQLITWLTYGTTPLAVFSTTYLKACGARRKHLSITPNYLPRNATSVT